MSYQVLARKLRPRDFTALVGQDHIVRALVHALDNDRLHHAYLFTGTRGVGKTTIARILARCLNCETGVSSTPCGTCSTCVEILENRFVDLLEVDAASRTRVDDTRELLDNAQYLPSRGRYKVYLIDEVHMLSASSFNALLKTLEEPPEHVKFLLATTDPKKVPVTVLSRCLQFQLKNLSPDVIAGYLRGALADEQVEADRDALTLIARAARGSMRDALSITDQAVAFCGGALHADGVSEMLGVVGGDETGALLRALADDDAHGLLAVCGTLAERGVDFAGALDALIAELHQQAVRHALNATEPGDLGPEMVQLFYQIAIMGLRDLHLAPDERCGFEMALLRMLNFAPDTPRGGGARASSERSGGTAAADRPGRKAGSAGSGPAGPGAGTAVKRASAGSAGVDVRAQEAADDRPVSDTGSPDDLPPDGWFQWVQRSGLSGVARMIADNCVLIGRDGDRWHLMLDADHDTLLTDAQVAHIERALVPSHGSGTRVHIEVGTPASETPARRVARETAERQARAEAELRQDATVRALIQEFGGSLGGVTPVDDARSAAAERNPE